MQTKRLVFSIVSIMVATAFVLSACGGGAAVVPDVAAGLHRLSGC